MLTISCWRYEKVAEKGASQFGEERLARQYVDGQGIDSHICVNIFNETGDTIEKTYWFVQNARGDTVALTDDNGEVVKHYAYSAYGIAYEVGEDGTLTPVEDFLVV